MINIFTFADKSIMSINPTTKFVSFDNLCEQEEKEGTCSEEVGYVLNDSSIKNSEKARILFALELDRSRIASLLGMSYAGVFAATKSC